MAWLRPRDGFHFYANYIYNSLCKHFKFFNFFFFFAVCGLSLVVASEGYSLVAGCGPLSAVAPPVAEHKL